MTVTCISILPLKFCNLQSTLYMSSTLVAP